MDKAVIELIRQAMPQVMRLVAEKRREWGDAHVTECQRRGMAGEPGWFWAREGCLAVGTPWDDPELGRWGASALLQAQVWMRPPGAQASAGGSSC